MTFAVGQQVRYKGLTTSNPWNGLTAYTGTVIGWIHGGNTLHIAYEVAVKQQVCPTDPAWVVMPVEGTQKACVYITRYFLEAMPTCLLEVTIP